MKAICINGNSWYLHEGKMCGYLEQRDGIKGISFMQEVNISGQFRDRFKDLFYIIDGELFPYEAEWFIPISEVDETEIAAESESVYA